MPATRWCSTPTASPKRKTTAGDEYGLARLQTIIEQNGAGCPMQLVDACKQHLDGFRGRNERFDDETLLAIQYAPTALHEHSHRAAVV